MCSQQCHLLKFLREYVLGVLLNTSKLFLFDLFTLSVDSFSVIRNKQVECWPFLSHLGNLKLEVELREGSVLASNILSQSALILLLFSLNVFRILVITLSLLDFGKGSTSCIERGGVCDFGTSQVTLSFEILRWRSNDWLVVKWQQLWEASRALMWVLSWSLWCRKCRLAV